MLGAVLTLATLETGAATVYVTDDIAVGLHAERRADSAIVTMLRSGVELEVLERDGNLIRVRTVAGEEGWLDGNYAVDDPPARAQLLTATSTNEALNAELSALRREIDRLRSDLIDAEESRKRQIANLSRGLEGQLRAAEEQLETLRDARLQAADAADADRTAELAELTRLRAENESLRREASEGGRIPSATLREMQRLAEENRALKTSLNEAGADEDTGGSPESPSSSPAAAGGPPGLWESFTGASPFALALIGFGGLLVYALGWVMQDWLTRRRHGGFRL